MSHKLLLADDSVTIQRVIELTFADEDVKVIAVGDGQQAIDRIEAELPDIVLADVGMPSRDGYQVAAYVKSTPHLAHIPVLLLTGAFEPVDEERARAAGCDGVLAKPFEPQMVIARVKELLASSAGHAGRAPVAPSADMKAEGGADLMRTGADDGLSASSPAFDAVLDIAPPSPSGDQQPWAFAAPAAESDLRIRRRPPVYAAEPPRPVSADGRPAEVREPSASGNPLDDYFDRLDAAFATLSRPAAGESPAPQVAEASGGAGLSWSADLSLSRDPATDLINAPLPQRAAQSGIPAASSPMMAAGAPPSPVEPTADPDRSPMAQAFSALLAVERGDEAASVPSFWPFPAVTTPSVDEIVDRVTREVLERMTDRAVREAVTDVVSRIAERLIREEIDRVKATIT